MHLKILQANILDVPMAWARGITMLSWSDEHRAFMRSKFPVAFELFYAIFEGSADDVRRRLEAGDDPNARGVDGDTPMHYATRFDRDLPKAELLYLAGARVDGWDDLGTQPIHRAVGLIYDARIECLLWLLDHGADPNAAVRRGTMQLHPVGWTPLHIAVDHASLAATQLLIERGADVNAAAVDGATPLHVAARKWRVYKRLVRLLLDAGAEMNATDAQGRTPLHVLAGHYGRYRLSVIRLLRFRGARLDIRDAEGRRAVDVVQEGVPATEEIRKLLRA